MERRLVPVNALIALCTPGDIYPSPLAEAGYYLAGVEVPVSAGDGTVVIDVVLFRPECNIILATEAKSGANVDERQARRYGALIPDDVVTSAALTIRQTGKRQVQPLYVCLREHLDRVLMGMGEAGLACPVLTVATDAIEHHGGAFADPDVEAAFDQRLTVPGPPPRILLVDEDSPDEAFDALVLPALVASLSHQRPQVSIPALAEEALPHLLLFGRRARNRLVAKVERSARGVAQRDPGTFQYSPRTGVREYAVIRFTRSPETAARQGRTQVYQSIARAAGKPAGRHRSPGADQMDIFDELIKELQQSQDAVDVEDGADDRDEEEQ